LSGQRFRCDGSFHSSLNTSLEPKLSLRRELLEEALGFLQINGVKALGEPAVSGLMTAGNRG
jgi:hypothetical protein